MQPDEKGTRKSKRSRYWSVMLVGDHGRVIPFRHFKALTIAVGVVLLLSLGALTLLGFLHVQLRRQIVDLQNSLQDTRAQTTKLRDEKDLYLTRLIALQKQNGELSPKDPGEKAESKIDTPSETRPSDQQKTEEKKQAPEQAKKPEPEVKSAPQVQWSADIRKFNVSYDNRRQILRVNFRIYNTSRPKNTLSGRTVVVFKAADDPPIHWAIVPVVPLRGGKPIGKKGKPFRIHNYRTEHFVTLRGKYSAEYNTASIYIFTEQGELIANKEMPINVDYSAPAPVKAAKPEHQAPAPEPGKNVETPAKEPKNHASPAAQESKVPALPEPVSPDVTQQETNAAPETPPTEVNQPVQPENKTQEPQGAMDTNESPAKAKDESSNQTPATEPQPEAVGGVK